VGDPDQTFGGLEAAVERVHLVAETVEPLEDRVELSVVQMLTFRSH